MTVNYKTLSDLELASLIKEGDREAFSEVYRRYVFVLLNHAYNKTRNREAAKDAVQEVFAGLWSRRAEVNFETNVAGFLYASVRNLILNQFARQGVQERYLDSMLAFTGRAEAETDYLVREKQLAALIDREIAALSPKMRDVFELSRRAHLSHREIAERMDISEQTVNKHMTNALRVLRVKLGIFSYLLWLFIS